MRVTLDDIALSMEEVVDDAAAVVLRGIDVQIVRDPRRCACPVEEMQRKRAGYDRTSSTQDRTESVSVAYEARKRYVVRAVEITSDDAVEIRVRSPQHLEEA